MKILNCKQSFGFIPEDFQEDENDLRPLVGTDLIINGSSGNHDDFLLEFIADKLEIVKDDIYDFDLCMSLSEDVEFWSGHNEFIKGPRLNHLIGSWSH